jgi:hypothetical protein
MPCTLVVCIGTTIVIINHSSHYCDNGDTRSIFLSGFYHDEPYGCCWQYLRRIVAGVALETESAGLRTPLLDVIYHSRLLLLICGQTSSYYYYTVTSILLGILAWVHGNFKLNVEHRVSMAVDSGWTETHYDLPDLELQVRQSSFFIHLILTLNIYSLSSVVLLFDSY